MIAIMKEASKGQKFDQKKYEKKAKQKDVIVKRVQFVNEENAEGDQVIRKREKLVNITKIVNETKKAIKIQTAVQKAAAVQEDLINKGVL